MDIKVNFSGRAIRYTEEEIAVVVEAMRNADPLTQSRYMQEFESKFARYQGVAQGSCFTAMNGASALEMSAQLCLLKPGETEAPDGKIGLGILYEDNTREELCEVQAEKKEAARK